MAVWSSISRQDFGFGDRFDAEFYQPSFRHIRSNLYDAQLLKYCLQDIRYGLQAEPEYIEHGVEYIRAMNLNAPWISGNILQIPQNQLINEDYRLEEGDILITRSGANCGSVGLITSRFTGATFGSYTIRLRTDSKTDPFTLFAFFLTDVGRTLTLQARYGSAQPNLSIPYLKNLILVPKFSDALTSQVRPKILDAINTAHSEMLLYKEAEAELLERLGWEVLQKKPLELSYILDFNRLAKNARADAEFFQPQYVRLRTELLKHGTLLGDLVVSFDKGTQPDCYTDEGEVIVVKSKQVTGRGLDLESCEKTVIAAYADITARLKAGDIVINSTGRGTLGRVAVIPTHNSKVVAAVDLIIAHLNIKDVVPDYLALFLNSPAGVAQSEQFQTGSSGQLHLYQQHFAQFVVFLPRNKNGAIDIEWQRRLASKVQASTVSKQKAKQKLEEAKRLVEKALFHTR